MPRNVLAVLPFVLLLGAACDRKPSSSASPSLAAATAPRMGPSAAEQKEAEDVYSTRCTACHGATGLGDGAAAAALTPKPRNFADAAWQSAVADEAIEKIIKAGGPAVGKSPNMPPNDDLSPSIIAALRAKLRAFKP